MKRLAEPKFLAMGAALVILAGLTTGLILASNSAAGQNANNATLPPATAEVTRTTLVENRTVGGTLGYRGLATVRASGAGTVTWMAPLGSTVARGEPLFMVDGKPVVALYGAEPMYRPLSAGDEFATEAYRDVLRKWFGIELTEEESTLPPETLLASWGADLRVLFDPDERFRDIRQGWFASGAPRNNPETRWDETTIYAWMNLTPGTVVGTCERNRPEREGASCVQAELEAAWEALEAAGTRMSGADVRQLQENLAELGYSDFEVDGVFDQATADAVRAWQADLGLPTTGAIELGQVVFTPGPVRIAEHTARVGDALGNAGGPVLRYTDTQRVVTVELRVADLALAVEGNEVSVTVPTVGNVTGVISHVGTVIANGNAQVTVSIPDQEALGRLDASSVDIRFVSRAREDVLTVPVAALLALAEGGYGVEIVDGNTARIVPVNVGMFASGRVEVSGEAIAEGVRIGVPR